MWRESFIVLKVRVDNFKKNLYTKFGRYPRNQANKYFKLLVYIDIIYSGSFFFHKKMNLDFSVILKIFFSTSTLTQIF